MFVTPGESLIPQVLLLEQESYLPYIINVIKEILKTADPFHFQTYTIKSILQFFKVTSAKRKFFAIR